MKKPATMSKNPDSIASAEALRRAARRALAIGKRKGLQRSCRSQLSQVNVTMLLCTLGWPKMKGTAPVVASKKIVIIAGPNGTGKTTFAREFLPREAGCLGFINVDLIAEGLSPFDPERASLRAGRLVLQEIHRRTKLGESFAFETTLSGRCYASLIPRWRAAGYDVQLIFLALPTADLAVARVSARVAQGGHDIAEEVLRRRFDKGLHNFHNIYRGLVSSWVLYDNSGNTPRLIQSGDNP